MEVKERDKTINMTNLNLVESIDKVSERITHMEELLGKGAAMPSNSSNSGPRKILHSTQFDQRMELLNSKLPLLCTGAENQFGIYSSSFITSDSDKIVIAKIPKYLFLPNHHYYLIVQSNKGLDVIERVAYKHTTETYGYLYNNAYIDSLHEGNVIEEGRVIKKSTSFDEFNNRMDGVDLNIAYLSKEHTKEDGIEVSIEAAEDQLAAPLIKNFQIVVNDNHIPLNLKGNENVYKSFPDIGEEILDGIFMGIRIEKKEESLYTQSTDKLRRLMISDEKYLAGGQVVNIDIYCNNPELLENSYHSEQLKFYYDNKIKSLTMLVDIVKPMIESGVKCSYELQKMYYDAKRVLEGKQYLKDKPFSNIILEVTVLDKNPAKVGDKITNRYGGKGVISRIVPKEEMPIAIIMGEEVPIDMIYNSSTCVNRENAGQLFESSTNYVGSCIAKYFKKGVLSIDECLDMYNNYMEIVAPSQCKAICEYMNSVGERERKLFIDDIIEVGGIRVSQKPITECMTIDKLNELYKRFPWIKQAEIIVPQRDSNGNFRKVRARRNLVIGAQYIYREKQYAEEKFSAVSLAATNIRNENSRSNAKKTHRSPHSKTPIKFFGEMETHDLIHAGVENAVINLMLHATSPQGRRLCEELLTGDPFKINIKLDDTCKNRSVEILNAYLTTMGLRLEFKKIPKEMKRALIRPRIPAMIRVPIGATTAMVRLPQGEAMPIRHMEESRKEFNNGEQKAMMKRAMIRGDK